LAVLADAQRRQGNIEDAETTCSRALKIISDGSDRWIEPEVRRIDAIVARDSAAYDAKIIEDKFRSSVECARKLSFLPFELHGLLSLRDFLGNESKGSELEARICELAYLNNLEDRVAEAVRNHGYNRRATLH